MADSTTTDIFNNFSSSDSLEKDISSLSLSEENLACISEEIISLDLFTAASIGNWECIQAALDDGSDINAKNRGGWTPIMYSAFYGHEKIVKLFLQHKADPDVCNNAGCSPLILAAMCGNDHVIRALLVRCGQHQMATKDASGWTALMHACHLGHQNVVKVLLENGDDPNITEENHKWTPLIIAAAEGHEVIVQYLMHFGAKVGAASQTGETARTLAYLNGHFKLVSLLDNSIHSLNKVTLLNIQEGPTTLAKLMSLHAENNCQVHKQNNNNNNGFTHQTPKDLLTFLEILGLGKYYKTLADQDVDLQVFLTLTDSDLKEVGITLLGPRRKMTSAIARWHSSAPLKGPLEKAYADKLEVEMQEMGLHVHKALLHINELQKQIEQERQLRYVIESSLAEKNGCISEIAKMCQEAKKCVEIIQKQMKDLNENIPPSPTPTNKLCQNVNIVNLQTKNLCKLFGDISTKACVCLRSSDKEI